MKTTFRIIRLVIAGIFLGVAVALHWIADQLTVAFDYLMEG